MSAQLTVDVKELRAGVVVRPRGELDLSTRPQLDAALTASVERARRVTLDLRELAFMDCAGLRCIVEAHSLSRAAKCDLRIIRARPSVQNLFEITGFGHKLRFVAPAEGARGMQQRAA